MKHKSEHEPEPEPLRSIRGQLELSRIPEGLKQGLEDWLILIPSDSLRRNIISLVDREIRDHLKLKCAGGKHGTMSEIRARFDTELTAFVAGENR